MHKTRIGRGGGGPHPLFPQVFYLKFFIWDSENHSEISPQEQIKKRNATHYASTSWFEKNINSF